MLCALLVIPYPESLVPDAVSVWAKALPIQPGVGLASLVRIYTPKTLESV